MKVRCEMTDAANKAMDATVAALVGMAREWADAIEASNLPYTGPQALRVWANTQESVWRKTAPKTGANHAA